MNFNAFTFTAPNTIHFGRGSRSKAAGLAATFGRSVLVVHGATSKRAEWLLEDCANAGLTVQTTACNGEPDLPLLEAALPGIRTAPPDVIIALGGGSVMDFAKALAALVPCTASPRSYLEVVGDGRSLDAAPLPVIALPTTAGTGSEVTRNAVITVPDRAIKVSLRDPRMIPCAAIVDADLMEGAPKAVILAAALDAVTQVIEPYLSVKANPMSDALCRGAIPEGIAALRPLIEEDSAEALDRMAWVSTCGGLALANSGLGAVHGFAGVIGGITNAPHGEICGALLPAVLASHRQKAPQGSGIAERTGWVLDLINEAFATGDQPDGVLALQDWSRTNGLRGLSAMGLDKGIFAQTAALSAGASSMKGNPFPLSQSELVAILEQAA
ncbi:iron-containing alcohol dehydrogenase [Neptunicoccus cionae]|uniref:iron-containing alcohol dehydrogenase n=1 Tax=Neptunicoccus cionae TaxID=2035344 RepID=UPI000C78F859|nr:iron-containing alcohol dehydrogenase [Amylibacter cionae]PLS21532.1 alcohol dehydrogenase [Amylibacter cionae]